jgi:hypothetical protein
MKDGEKVLIMTVALFIIPYRWSLKLNIPTQEHSACTSTLDSFETNGYIDIILMV